MSNYNTIIEQLQSATIITDNYEIKDDILIIDISPYVVVILSKDNNKVDMYINNQYFGNLDYQNIDILFKALLKEDKVFIEYRKPIGFYQKEYFKIETLEWFNKRREKLLKRRGTKIYTLNEVIMDLY